MFRYLSMQDKLGEQLSSYSGKDCIVCQNQQLKFILEMHLCQEDLLKSRPSLVSLEEFLSSVCVTNQLLLKDIHRVFSLYQVLTEEQKRKWKIRSYFDFVDIANEFFQFYEECMGLESKVEELILPWQQEKFFFFQELKIAFDEKNERENSIPKEWLYQKEYYHSYFAKTFSKIVFFDIIDFPRSFLEILPLLQKDCELEFVLQVCEGDFEEEKLFLRNCSLEDWEGECHAYQIGSDWEESLYLLAERAKKTMGIYSHKAKEKRYDRNFPSVFVNPSRDRFNETNLYEFLEGQLELLRQKESSWKQELPITSLLETIRKKSFRDYYGFWEEDIVLLKKLLSEEFRYLSIDLLHHSEYAPILEGHIEFTKKMETFLKDLWAIESFEKVSDLYIYFEESIVMESWKQEEYPDILDSFYEVLARLSFYEKNEYFGSYTQYFDGNTGRQLYQLLFRSLDQIYLKSAEEFVQEKLEIRDWHNLSYEKTQGKKGKRAIFLDVDDKSLPGAVGTSTFLTENQRISLGFKTQEEQILQEKYRFYQALATQEELIFLIRKSEAENKTTSSFLEEWLWKQKKKIEKSPYSKEFFLNSLEKTFTSPSSWKRKEEEGSLLEKENRELMQGGELFLGAYDWQKLQDCEKYFYFSQTLPVEKEEKSLSFGFSSSLLGIIAHRFLESVGKKYWKEFLRTGKFSFREEELLQDLKKEIARESLKYPSFLSRYLEEIVAARIVKNTIFFLRSIEKKYQGKALKRFQGEKNTIREGIYRGEDLQISFRGRADLIIETENSKEIVDYKTGNTIEDQLDFYSYLFYGEEEDIQGSYFHLWKGDFALSKKKEAFTAEKLEEFFQKFEEQSAYHISRKKAACLYCPYIKICNREEEVCQD